MSATIVAGLLEDRPVGRPAAGSAATTNPESSGHVYLLHTLPWPCRKSPRRLRLKVLWAETEGRRKQ